ncbi:hypothetical protein BCR44DRAFT_23095 [Catenaria anguillulae PL171]|uniref:Ricin B lectin domain-containing protein n=1 Tax=Catenaria anguillulae PL171 TaxID=765915 RepID=A0A1Y2HYK7_9FUNG|nr:hypothetical protein BCR44DRAFT_23095 [Catenaria anguillulae PL171]
MLSNAVVLLALVAIALAQNLPAPFPLPATYSTGTNGHRLTIERNGQFTITSHTQCIAAPCPEAGGNGEWTWNDKTGRFTLRQNVDANTNWIVSQTWAFPTMSEDMLNRRVQAKLVASKGVRANEFPVPAAAKWWVRVTNKGE